MSNQIKAIAFCCGYAESNKISWVVFNSRITPDEFNERQAIESLTEYLYQSYLDEYEMYGRKIKNCCTKYKNEGDSFCGKCGYNLKNKDFNPDVWKESIIKLHEMECVSYMDEANNPDLWEPWGFEFNIPTNQMLVISHQAENVFLKVLVKLHPELGNDIDEYEYRLFDFDQEELDVLELNGK